MTLIDLMKRNQHVLCDLIEETSQRLKQFDILPKRTLVSRTRKSGDSDYYEQYYSNRKKIIHPLGKADAEKVIAYKQQRYLREKLKILENNYNAIGQLLSTYKDYSTEAIQEMLPRAYKDITVSNYSPISNYENMPFQTLPLMNAHLPHWVTNDERFQKLVEWASEDYPRNPYPLPDDPNIARDGTPMRSKGECMWYDNILFEGIPVRVDPEIQAMGKSGQWHKLYPDFVFKCFDESELYVEHFGEWDDEKYAERNKQKIQKYLDCGFVLGDNLIGTSDNVNHRTNELMIIEALERIKMRMFR